MDLKHLTDKILLNDMASLAEKERALLSKVLWHLREIDRRKLYSTLKCGSLFEYCVKILKYFEGQASRRVSACRLLKDLPEIEEDIRSGELNLTQLNQAKNFFNEQNIDSPEDKKGILEKIKGKTTRKTEEILWELRKEDSPRKVSLVLNEETLMALKKIQALKAHAYSDMDKLLMKMCEDYSKIWDPTIIQRKRAPTPGQTRYVPVQVRSEVWKRDKGKCTNCGSTYALELDHIQPFKAGGKTKTENLRLLCRNCNQRKGMEYFNKTFAF